MKSRRIVVESRCDHCNGKVVTRKFLFIFRFGYQIRECYGEHRAEFKMGVFTSWPPPEDS